MNAVRAKASSGPTTVTVLIPAYNEEKYIGSCLEHLLEHRTDNVVQIIVVDNASTDATPKIARAYPGVTVLSEKRKGTNYARQCGLAKAKGDLVACIDADTRVTRGWFEVINREFGAHPDLLCLSGTYVFYDLPFWKRWAVYWVWMGAIIPAMFFTGYAVCGGNAVAKRSALEAIGGFDTSIAFYGDDINTGRRLRRIGRVRFSADFRLYSSARRIVGQGFLKTCLLYGWNFLSEAVRHAPASQKYADFR